MGSIAFSVGTADDPADEADGADGAEGGVELDAEIGAEIWPVHAATASEAASTALKPFIAHLTVEAGRFVHSSIAKWVSGAPAAPMRARRGGLPEPLRGARSAGIMAR
jgi:hypothetical protein